jgi:hypothetical protein
MTRHESSYPTGQRTRYGAIESPRARRGDNSARDERVLGVFESGNWIADIRVPGNATLSEIARAARAVRRASN